MKEFLVQVTVDLPAGMPEREVAELLTAERARGQELRREGTIQRIWRVPSDTGIRNVGVWRARDEDELRGALGTLPLHPWLTAEVTPLETHPLEAAG